MLKFSMVAAAILIAAPAWAQTADEYRLIASSDEVVVLASSKVTGPQNARRFSELLVRRERSDAGADAYQLDALIDCTAGTFTIGHVKVYAGTEVIREIEAQPNNTSKPDPTSVAGKVLAYGCRGESQYDDPTRVNGAAAAITYGRKVQGLD